MKPYRNAALFIGSLLALVIVSAGEGFTAEYVVFLVVAGLGVLVVSLLVLKALLDDKAGR
ncbi:hypothetical protein [Mycolicibacterium fallax]|uniref:Uncharacterized protein n=2 Tax=Mycolicibacterium fallax TaxID=1793 RepID=A0A1X1RN52_MYCFA|nr:hypothetical protein [Mycolicibacterium fallax]ORV10045.1 hypothetical protein AWC04_01055 [Mycolicibacterium fallax]